MASHHGLGAAQADLVWADLVWADLV